MEYIEPVKLILDAYDFVVGRFRKYVDQSMFEVGTYLIETFFDGDIELARNPRNIKSNKSFHQLIHMIQKHNAHPKRSWLYLSLRYVAAEYDHKDLPAYAKLYRSHKLALVRLDKFPKGKIALIEESVEEDYSCRQLLKRINEVKSQHRQYKRNSSIGAGNMAAIMQCPSCKRHLAELGDADKGQGRESYRVYDNVVNFAEAAGIRRVLECLACGYIGDIDKWEA